MLNTIYAERARPRDHLKPHITVHEGPSLKATQGVAWAQEGGPRDGPLSFELQLY